VAFDDTKLHQGKGEGRNFHTDKETGITIPHVRKVTRHLSCIARQRMSPLLLVGDVWQAFPADIMIYEIGLRNIMAFTFIDSSLWRWGIGNEVRALSSPYSGLDYGSRTELTMGQTHPYA
jgi:hypothetical protein